LKVNVLELLDATDARVQDTTQQVFGGVLHPHASSKVRVVRTRGVEKGELRIVTHALVRPGRSYDFVNHLTSGMT